MLATSDAAIQLFSPLGSAPYRQECPQKGIQERMIARKITLIKDQIWVPYDVEQTHTGSWGIRLHDSTVARNERVWVQYPRIRKSRIVWLEERDYADISLRILFISSVLRVLSLVQLVPWHFLSAPDRMYRKASVYSSIGRCSIHDLLMFMLLSTSIATPSAQRKLDQATKTHNTAYALPIISRDAYNQRNRN